jgi:hypothetical protein
MPKTVNGAFDEFLKETVNLDKDETTTARSSRNWLLEQITLFGSDTTFPKLWQEYNIHFGSFARRTKIRPLDDIDLMIGLSAQGATYTKYTDRIEIIVNPETNLKSFCKNDSNILNSIKVINKFVSKLSGVSQYKNAEIKRNQEAVTLNLKSYDWTFDIVPCFFTSTEIYNRTYYLIPDGKGNWKKTDPRMDRDRTQTINQKHSGYVLNVVRIIKYWNKRPTMPTMSSYLLENLILNYYDSQVNCASQYVDIEIPNILNYISTNIYYNVNDPKNIQGNINSLSYEEKVKISDRAKLDYQKSIDARKLENDNEHEKSIKKWTEIFGDKFPKYE